MIVGVVNGSKYIQIQFTDDEWIIVDWVFQTYGPNVFKDYMDKWLSSRLAQKNETDRLALHDAFTKANKSDKDSILATLKLDGKIK